MSAPDTSFRMRRRYYILVQWAFIVGAVGPAMKSFGVF